MNSDRDFNPEEFNPDGNDSNLEDGRFKQEMEYYINGLNRDKQKNKKQKKMIFFLPK